MAKRGPQRRPSGVGNTKSSDKRPTGREVIGFVEKFLRIPDGPHAGQPLILAPWKKQEIHRIYDNPVATRRAIISTARKNAKTTLCGALLLNHLCGPSARNRPNTRLYSSGQSRDQAAAGSPVTIHTPWSASTARPRTSIRLPRQPFGWRIRASPCS